jgi:hypothetical protein
MLTQEEINQVRRIQNSGSIKDPDIDLLFFYHVKIWGDIPYNRTCAGCAREVLDKVVAYLDGK